MRLVNKDDGTVLLWTLGVFIVASATLVALLSLGSFIIAQRKLETLSDNASLAAVASLSLQSFIQSGNVAALSLDKNKALQRITQTISDSHSRATVEKVTIGNDQVTIALGADWTDISGRLRRHITATSTANFTPEIAGSTNP